MLNTHPPVYHPAARAPGLWPALRDAWQAGLKSGFFHFLLILVLASGLTCLYVWQTTAISTIEHDTDVLHAGIRQIERENVALIVQVARWHAPGYVAQKAAEQGLVSGQSPLYVKLPAAAAAVEHEPAGAALWRQLTGWMPTAKTAEAGSLAFGAR